MDTWEQLRAIIQKRRDSGTESDGDWHKQDVLQDKRNQEVEAELPHPQCCGLAKKHLFPYRDINHRTEEVRNGGVPVWRNSFPTKWRSAGYRETHIIYFCPFCGTKLPGFRLKKEPPPHLCIENGDYHCGGCGERWDGCYCSLHEAAYEIED